MTAINANNASINNKLCHDLSRLGNQKFKSIKNDTKDIFSSMYQTNQEIFYQAMAAMKGNGEITHPQDNVPTLKKPKVDDTEKLTPEARFELTMMEISNLSADSKEQSLKSASQEYTTFMEGAFNKYTDLAAQMEKAIKNWVADFDNVNHTKNQFDGLNNDVTELKQQIQNDQDELKKLQNGDANGTDNTKLIAKVKADLASKNEQLSSLNTLLTKAKSQYQSGQQAYNQSVKNLSGLHDSASNFYNGMTIQQQQHISAKQLQQGDIKKSIVYLMAVISKLISDSSTTQISAEEKLNQVMSETSIEVAKKNEKDYQAKIEKAKEVQKTASCVSKILGWAITAVSMVAAVFTGGASLAIAAVALTVTAADQIDQAVTGNSFIQQALSPIMNDVLKPIIDAIGSVFSDILKDCGVDADTAKMVGEIIGSIVVSVAVIAAAVLAAGAVAKVAGKLISSLSKDVAEDAIEDSLGAVTESATEEAIENASTDMTSNVENTSVKSDVKMAEDIDAAVKQQSEALETAENTSTDMTSNVENTSAKSNAKVTEDIDAAAKEQSEVLKPTPQQMEKMQKTLMQTVKSTLEKISGGLGKYFGCSDEQIESITLKTKIANNLLLGPLGAAAGAVNSITGAQANLDTQKLKSMLLVSEALQKVLSTIIDTMLESNKQALKTASSMGKQSADIGKNNTDVLLDMAKHISIGA